MGLDAARLTVNQQIVSVQYQLIESDLKTPTSRRNIDLDPRTVAELRRHRRRQLEERMATGQRGDDGYVFAKPDGSPIHPDLVSQTFERAVARLDDPRIRLHDLRHTHATILLQQNVHPKVVSERLGHSSVAFTMTVYQHVMPRPTSPSSLHLRNRRLRQQRARTCAIESPRGYWEPSSASVTTVLRCRLAQSGVFALGPAVRR